MSDSPAHGDAAAAKPKKKSSMLGKILVLMFIALVVAGECAGVCLFLPSPQQTAALAGAAAAGTSAHAAGEKEKEGEHKPADAKAGEKGEKSAEGGEKEKDKKPGGTREADEVEVDLGDFTITASQPARNSTLRIALHIYGTVATADAADFNARLKASMHRFRDQIITTLRSTEISALTDARLGLLKTTILEKTNGTLGKALLKTVVLSDFSFAEL